MKRNKTKQNRGRQESRDLKIRLIFKVENGGDSKTLFFAERWRIACGWFHPFYVSLHILKADRDIRGLVDVLAHRVQTFTVIIRSLLCFTLRIKLRDKRARTWFRSKLCEGGEGEGEDGLKRDWRSCWDIKVVVFGQEIVPDEEVWSVFMVELAGICISFFFLELYLLNCLGIIYNFKLGSLFFCFNSIKKL